MDKEKAKKQLEDFTAKVAESKPVKAIKSKSKTTWYEQYKTWLSDLYNLFTDDGEKALIAGVVIGVLLVLLFQYVVLIVAILAFLALLVWVLAPEEAEKPKAKKQTKTTKKKKESSKDSTKESSKKESEKK